MHKNPEMRKQYLREYNARNRQHLLERQRIGREERRSWAVELLGGKCVHCGSQDDLHFDHIDPSTKVEAIGRMLTLKEASLRAELAKCQLLCGQCHRTKTVQNRDHGFAPTQHGSSQMYTRYKCRCEACRLWKRNYDIEWKRKRKTT